MAKYQNITCSAIQEECATFHESFHENIPEKFQELLSALTEALADEAWLGDDGWDPACDLLDATDDAWRDIAERAAEIQEIPASLRFLPLRRMAGLIGRAVDAVNLAELHDVCARAGRCTMSLRAREGESCRDLVIEAQDCLDEMACQAAARQAREAQAEDVPAPGLRFAA